VQKILVFIFLSLCPTLLFGQKLIKLLTSEEITGDIKNSINHIKRPVFQQDNATMTCDSAVLYQKRNYFEAFGNVHIHQENTDIYSDQLEYNGNTKKAHLTKNVRMVDPTSVLTTNVLDYDMVAKIGTYTTGGKIVNKDVTLTSKNGYYFSTSSDAYFRYNVVVLTPQTTIKSDTMRYNMQSKWTYFYGPTNIKGKDDNMYTENGAYNTQTDNAYFGKKNLYTQGTRSLKGDSLYYDGIAGIGKAVKNIVFSDTKDKTKLFGDLGYYYKKDQRTMVMGHAYFGIGTQDSITINNKKRPDSLFMGADTLETQMVLQKTLKLIPKISVKADNSIEEDEDEGSKEPKYKPENIQKANNSKSPKETSKKGKNDDKAKIANLADKVEKKVDSVSKKIEIKTDTLLAKTAKIADTTKKVIPNLKIDTSKIAKTNIALNKGETKLDSTKFNPADTVQARTIKAYHNVKMYKSNIQAKTDSLFYTSADSTLRFYSNPIIWSEGSQQIGDTIYVQLKKNKLDNVQAFKNAFLVNTPADSLRFNQIKGRVMTGFFVDGKFKDLFVDGNAESIYFNQDDSTKVYKEMNQTLSSRIKFIFKNSTIKDIIYIKNIEGALNPDKEVKKDHVLTGFSWKPTERPKSKKEVIGSALKGSKKQSVKKAAAKSTNPQVELQQKINPEIGKIEIAKPITKAQDSTLIKKQDPIIKKLDSIKKN
jgi:lipopolysaccharide export system protein LptA